MTFRSLRLPQLLLSAIPLLMAALPQASAQESYPNRLIRIIVPTSPGAGLDVTARLIAQGLTERLGWRVVVENRAGASTMIGNEMVAKAPPDGYTLLMGVSSLVWFRGIGHQPPSHDGVVRQHGEGAHDARAV